LTPRAALGTIATARLAATPPGGRCITTSTTPTTLTAAQARDYAAYVSPLVSGFHAPFFKLASVQPGERVLDIGCGPGDTTIEAAQRSGPTGEVLGIDIAPAFVALAQERGLEAGSRARFAVMDAQALDQPTSYWDVVICHLAIDAFDDPRAALQEFVRVLRPVGRLAIATWGEAERSPWLGFALEGARAIAAGRPTVAKSRPFRYGASGVLSNLLAENGFGDVTPDRVSTSLDYPEAEAYWQAVERGLAGTIEPFAGLSSDQRAAAREAVAPELRKWRYPRSEAVHPPLQAFLAVAAKE
jgi:SAM-dependent methyltransferase